MIVHIYTQYVHVKIYLLVCRYTCTWQLKSKLVFRSLALMCYKEHLSGCETESV